MLAKTFKQPLPHLQLFEETLSPVDQSLTTFDQFETQNQLECQTNSHLKTNATTTNKKVFKQPKLTCMDYASCIFIWLIYAMAFIFCLHFYHVFKTYYNDPERIMTYNAAQESRIRCLTEQDKDFLKICASRQRWVNMPYIINILSDVSDEHVAHLKEAPELRDVIGVLAHQYLIRLIESSIIIIETLARSIWILVMIGIVLLLVNAYIFYKVPISQTQDMWQRWNNEKLELILQRDTRAQKSLVRGRNGTCGPLGNPLHKGSC